MIRMAMTYKSKFRIENFFDIFFFVLYFKNQPVEKAEPIIQGSVTREIYSVLINKQA